jgi:hypothetical protein
MKSLPLGHGRFAIVDDADFDRCRVLTWHLSPSSRTSYARTNLKENGRYRTVSLHRFLAGPGAAHIDHRNGDGLDNRRENLRIAGEQLNARNRPKSAGPYLSKYKGVTWSNKRGTWGRWRARITTDEGQKHLGYFVREPDAAHAYDSAARRYFGAFATLNFPEQNERAA